MNIWNQAIANLSPLLEKCPKSSRLIILARCCFRLAPLARHKDQSVGYVTFHKAATLVAFSAINSDFLKADLRPRIAAHTKPDDSGFPTGIRHRYVSNCLKAALDCAYMQEVEETHRSFLEGLYDFLVALDISIGAGMQPQHLIGLLTFQGDLQKVQQSASSGNSGGMCVSLLQSPLWPFGEPAGYSSYRSNWKAKLVGLGLECIAAEYDEIADGSFSRENLNLSIKTWQDNELSTIAGQNQTAVDSEVDLCKLFDELSLEMRAKFEQVRSVVDHKGLKGEAAEHRFREFLSDHYPRQISFSTGTVIDAGGKQSRQLDVIVHDSLKTPSLLQAAGFRVVPIECAYAVIEVKSILNADSLKKAIDNMLSVKTLRKTAYYPSYDGRTVKQYGRDWEIWPVNYFVFAFESSDIGTLAEMMEHEFATRLLEPSSRIDCVCVLDKGVICNSSEGKISALPSPGSTLLPYKTRHSLLMFYTLLAVYLNQAWLPHFRFNDYLGEIRF